MNQRNTELKALWDHFREGKAYPSENEIMSRMRIFARPNVKQDFEFLPELNPERITGMAPSGSPYWIETIDPPPWFIRYCGIDDDIDYADVFKKARGHKTFKRKAQRVRLTLTKRDG